VFLTLTGAPAEPDDGREAGIPVTTISEEGR
jgi:hypothetical protein